MYRKKYRIITENDDEYILSHKNELYYRNSKTRKAAINDLVDKLLAIGTWLSIICCIGCMVIVIKTAKEGKLNFLKGKAAPETIKRQYSKENYRHLPIYLFQNNTKWNDYDDDTCDHLMDNELYTIDSNQNICLYENVKRNGCCNTQKIVTCNDCVCNKENSCFGAYYQCVYCCLNNENNKQVTATKKDLFNNCKYMCTTSSNSNEQSRYYKNSQKKYCLGRKYAVKMEYARYASSSHQYAMIYNTELRNNCDHICKEQKMICTTELNDIFTDHGCHYTKQLFNCHKCRQHRYPGIRGNTCYYSNNYKTTCSNNNFNDNIYPFCICKHLF